MSFRFIDILRSWRKLNETLLQLTEEEVEHLLAVERANKRRSMIIKRLHQRLNKLRTNRERKELGVK